MKPRLGFFSFSCCEGCGLQVLNLEDELLDILGVVEIVNFREAMTEQSDDYDIAFVEGSITACVASISTGYPLAAIVAIPRISTTKLL